MAAELITPVDLLTGMPLSIAIPEDLNTLDDPENVNWHHHFHKASAPELQSLGGRALRSCRLQLVPAELHNYGKDTYHDIFIGSVLPRVDDTDTQFLLCVLACAGYVTREGLDVKSDNPEIPVRLTDNQIRRLQTKPEPRLVKRADVLKHLQNADGCTTAQEAWRAVRLRNRRQAKFSYANYKYSYNPIRDFFTDYLLTQKIDIDQKLMKRFLKTEDPAKQRALGETILAQTAAQSTSRFREQYQQARDSGLLHPNMHQKPNTLVLNKIGNYEQRGLLLPRLRERVVDLVD